MDLLQRKFTTTCANLRPLRQLLILLQPPVERVDRNIAEILQDLSGAEAAQKLPTVRLDSSIPCRLDQPLCLAGQGLEILQGQTPERGSRCFSVIDH